jgi:hypothetical protein
MAFFLREVQTVRAAAGRIFFDPIPEDFGPVMERLRSRRP